MQGIDYVHVRRTLIAVIFWIHSLFFCDSWPYVQERFGKTLYIFVICCSRIYQVLAIVESLSKKSVGDVGVGGRERRGVRG